ncbi:MAG: hypothetical protein ACXAB8_17090 [Promethearchaeota archaeon]|jgi:hypothetical protein
MLGFDDKEPITNAELNKYYKMNMSKFLEMMDKAHPEWKLKTTMISKKKDYANRVAKQNTKWVTQKIIKETVDSIMDSEEKSGKNKGKVLVWKSNKPHWYYIPANRKKVTANVQKHLKKSFEWLSSRGNLKGLTTYDWENWSKYFDIFHGGGGSSDSITMVGIKGYNKGTPHNLKVALIKAHHGLNLNENIFQKPRWKNEYTHRQTLNAWGLKKVKSIPQEKAPAKKKTTTKKKKAPAKKKTVRRVRKAPAKKKTTTKKKKAPAKKKTVRRVRKAPAKKKTTRRKR